MKELNFNDDFTYIKYSSVSVCIMFVSYLMNKLRVALVLYFPYPRLLRVKVIFKDIISESRNSKL